ncbi:hypothetical protein SNEBB_002972 [Seison nebaliae]|nr:hypothetical protein SNEBB_002972 [Seison nebaliae]
MPNKRNRKNKKKIGDSGLGSTLDATTTTTTTTTSTTIEDDITPMQDIFDALSLDPTKTSTPRELGDVVRNPFNEPASLVNTVGFCQFISYVHLLMFTPSILIKIQQNNECNQDICRVLSEVNSTTTPNMCKFPSYTQYAYLKHEFMCLTGMHKINKEHRKGRFSYGCSNTKFKIEDKSHSISNFFRMSQVLDRSCSIPDKFQPEISISRGRKYCGNKALGCIIKKATNIPDLHKYIDKYDLATFYVTKAVDFAFLLQHILYGPGNIGTNEIFAKIIFKDKEDVIIRGPNFLPKGLTGDSLIFFPHTNILYIRLRTGDIDRHHYDYDGTMRDFVMSQRTRLFEERVAENAPWVIGKANDLFHKQGYPKIVVIPEKTGEGNCYHPRMTLIHREYLAEAIGMVYDFLVANPGVTNFRHLTVAYPQSYKLARAPPRLPDKFWCGEVPCERKLFNGFSPSKKHKTYVLYAGLLIMDIWQVSIGRQPQLRQGLPNTPEFGHMWTASQKELVDFLWAVRAGNELSKAQAQIFTGYVQNLATDLTMYETAFLRDVFKAFTAKPGDLPLTVPDQDMLTESHSIVILKSMGSDSWYLVDNDSVQQIDNIRKETFWYEKKAYETDKTTLKQLISPIFMSDYKK